MNGNFGNREKEYFLNLFDTLLNKILGLYYNKSTADNDSILEILLGIRDEARSRKDYQLSDTIRDQLNKKGIKINEMIGASMVFQNINFSFLQKIHHYKKSW